MKTLIKLIVIGVIAGMTFNHLSEKKVDVKAAAQKFTEIIKDKISLIEAVIREENDREEATMDSGNDSNRTFQVPGSGTLSPDAPPAAGNSFNSDREPDRSEIDLTGTDVRAAEIPIPQKSGHNRERFRELDRYAASVPAKLEGDMDMLVKYLIGPARNKTERTRLVFSWIAQNIAYDDYGYNTGNYADVTAEAVFKNRVAVCQGFGQLFKVMGEKAGLDIVLVNGYAKGISYRPGRSFEDTNHAWNLVYLDNGWRHFDVTWAHGYGTAVKGKLVTIKEYDDYWFDTPADEFIFSHFPENPKWQLASVPLTLSQYERLPHAGASFFKLGFDGTACLQQACEGSLDAFPESYLNDGSVSALSMPYRKRIEAYRPIRIRLSSEYPADFALINNGEWVHLRKEGKEYSAVIAPEPGVLKLSSKRDDRSVSYNTLLEYRVN